MRTIHTGTTVPNALRLVGDVDLTSYDRLRGEMLRSGPLRLDCSGVGFADSTLLRLLVLHLMFGSVTVVAPTHQMLRLLEVSGVDGWPGLMVEP